MTSKEALEFIIKIFNELAQKPQDIGLFFKFCEAHGKVKQDLERLHKLEKVIEILKQHIEVYIYFGQSTINVTDYGLIQEEYDLLKEVLGDDK